MKEILAGAALITIALISKNFLDKKQHEKHMQQLQKRLEESAAAYAEANKHA